MSVHSQLSSDNKTVNIRIEGKFDFSCQREFREAYRNHAQAGQLFQVDLGRTEYMDSSALGMLLLLKEHADSCKGKVVLKQANGDILKILEMANFSRQFEIN